MSEHGRLDTDAADVGAAARRAMMAEIAARGPISCGVAATAALDAFAGGKVFAQHVPLANTTINHIVSVVGWGVARVEEGGDESDVVEIVGGETDESLQHKRRHRHHRDGVPYWIVRNSWGTPWAEDGYARVVTSAFRGGEGKSYNLALETACAWAVPGDWVDAADAGFVQRQLEPASKVEVA